MSSAWLGRSGEIADGHLGTESEPLPLVEMVSGKIGEAPHGGVAVFSSFAAWRSEPGFMVFELPPILWTPGLTGLC